MEMSKMHGSRNRIIGPLLLIVFVALGNTVAAWAEDDWKPRGGVEGLRPLPGVGSFAAFLNPQETAEAEQPQLKPENRPPVESYEDWLAASGPEGIARVQNGRFVLPAIAGPSMDMKSIGNGRVPEGFRSGDPGPTRLLPETSEFRGTEYWTMSYWAAANTDSNPRYFEDRMLERHGHERFPKLTPLIAGARFFTTVPMLPYLMTVSNPCQPESTLGYFRSGSAAPGLRQRPPYSTKASLVEAGVVAGVIVAFP